MNFSDATAVYIGAQAASAVYITDAAGTATKVWPTAVPAYPASGAWGPLTISFSDTVAATHTITEPGTYTVTHTTTGAGWSQATIDSPTIGRTNDPGMTGGGTAARTVTLPAGEVIRFIVTGVSSQPASGTWSITPA